MYSIVLIEFYFSDKKKSKLRPAIILTKPDTHGDIIVATITSNIHRASHKGDILIPSTNKSFPETGLKVSSVIRLSKLATIHNKRIKGELGLLPQSYQKTINKGITEVFSLD